MIESTTAASSTEERLIDGTLKCIEQKGLAATSSRDIAAAAGVNLAGITYHFGSKDELVAEALLRAAGRWLEPVIDALSTEADPAARLLAAIEALQTALEEARDLVPAYVEARVRSRHRSASRAADTFPDSGLLPRVRQSDVVAAASRSGEATGVRSTLGLDGLVSELQRFVADQLEEQRSAGYLPQWVDAQAMAGLLIAVADGIALHVALDPDIDHRAISAQAVQLLLAARG